MKQREYNVLKNASWSKNELKMVSPRYNNSWGGGGEKKKKKKQ